MDAPFVGTSLQGYALASDDEYPFPTSSISSCSHESSFSIDDINYNWESLSSLASLDSHLSVQDLNNEPFHGPNPPLDPFVSHTPAGRTPNSDLTMQPRVYNGSPSHTFTYTPPPSGQVVQLQWSPAPYEPPSHASVPPRHTLTTDALYPPYSDVPPDIKPPPSGVRLNPNPHQYHAYGVMCGKDNQSYTHANSSFSHMEANHKNHLPNHGPKLISRPDDMPLQFSTLQGARRLSLPLLDVSTSALSACGTMEDCIACPTCVPSNIFGPVADSDSAMLSVSALTTVRTPNSSLRGTAMAPSQSGSLNVLASPTPSVNKGASRRKSSGNSTSMQVVFMVKTTLLNLHDGFMWKKYGEKIIKRNKFTRSYFKCDEIHRCQCKALKRTQKCDDGEHILFTYVGRHNHP